MPISDVRPTLTDPESADLTLLDSQSNGSAQVPNRLRDAGSSNDRKNRWSDRNSGVRGGKGGGQKKMVVLKKYNDKLWRVKWGALFATGLHSLNQFLGLCALTWATVVILGGYVSELSRYDFYSVSALLLLEATRLAAAVLFGNIFTRKLVYRSFDPTKIRYNDVDRQVLIEVLRIMDQAFQLTVIAISVLLPLRRLEAVGTSKGNSFDGLHDSLVIFYSLVLINSIIAVIAVVHSKTITLLYVTSYDLRRFYDNIVWTGMDKGLLHAKDVDFLTFAMKTQADEYQRNLRAPVVYSLYEDLIEFLYHNKKGFEVACLSLDASDSYEREAAANLVGLWTNLEDLERPLLRLQRRLLSKLAEAVDNEETGRAATSSFEQLAKIDPKGLLDVKTQSGEKLVDILIDSIKDVVEVGRHDRALVYTKALTPLLENESCRVAIGEERLNLLAEKLEDVFRNDDCLKRMKAVAGYALRFLREGRPTKGDVTRYLRDPPPKEKEHILEEENERLLILLEADELPAEWSSHIEVRQIPSDPKAVPPFFARPATSFIAALGTLLVIFCAALLTFKYAPF